MAFFDKSNMAKPKGYSDEEIDRFVQYLRDNNLTIETEEEARELLTFQGNHDPSTVRRVFHVDPRLKIHSAMAIHTLWSEYPQYHDSSESLDITGMIFEPMMNAHEVLKKNFEILHEGEEDAKFDDFDENQQDILEFINEIEKRSSEILKYIDSKYSISSSQASSSIDLMKAESENMADYGGIDDDEIEKLSAMGGFNSTEELEAIMKEYLKSKEQGEIVEESSEEGDEPVDAEVMIHLSRNKVRAWIYVIPPRRGGNDITEEMVSRVLQENNIIYGVNKFMIKRIKQNQLYFKILEIAKGVDPVNGKNGTVNELFSREEYAVNIKEDSHGNVDYKEMNVIKSVHRGDTIAEITLPEPAKSGVQVTGEEAKGVDGKYPSVPAGANTSITEDRTKLVANIDGEVFFENNRFSIRNRLVINHDIDSSIGNVDFAGDIRINGNIKEGFTVKSEGNIDVSGYVEGAYLKAVGNVTISSGVYGGTNGKMDIGGNLKCRYIEHCTINVKGNVDSDQILGSDIFAEGKVSVSGTYGKIVGSTIFGGKGIKANFIGNDSNCSSVSSLSVGMRSVYIERSNKLLADLQEVNTGIQKLRQNISFLENKQNPDNSQKQLLDKLIFQLNIRNFQKDNINANIEKIKKKIDDGNGSSQIVCEKVNPPVNINHSGYKYKLQYELLNMRVYSIENTVYISGNKDDEQFVMRFS